MTTLILIPPDQVSKARNSDDPIGYMGASAVAQWMLNHAPEGVDGLDVTVQSYSYEKFSDVAYSFECRKMEKTLKQSNRIVWCSVCDKGPSPSVYIMGWNDPVDVMAKGYVVTIKGLKHYQLAPFQVQSMDTFFQGW